MEIIRTEDDIAEVFALPRCIVLFNAPWSGYPRRVKTYLLTQEGALSENGIVLKEAEWNAPPVWAWMLSLASPADREKSCYPDLAPQPFLGNAEVGWFRYGKLFGFENVSSFAKQGDFLARSKRYLPPSE